MDKKDSKSGIFELAGYTIKRTELGLDQEQVTSIMSQLLSQRDALLKRQEHLLALSQLAERTVAEADELARKFKREAEEQAEAEAKALLTKAEEQAQQIIEVKVAEAMASAQSEAATIRVDAEKQAQQIIEVKVAEAVASAQSEAATIRVDAEKQSEALLKERAQKLQSQMRDVAQQLCNEMLSQAESVKQQIAAFKANFEQELSELERFSHQEIRTQGDHTITETEPEVINETRTPTGTLDQSTTSETGEKAPPPETVPKTEGYEERTVLEILPPRDMDEIGRIKTYLESLPAVKMTELLNFTDRTVIEVFLAEQTDLTEKLQQLPQVEYAEEVTDGDHKKIQVRLSLVSALDMTKAKLGKTVSRILSSKQ
jgi:vacuolar-type H+-ATPase subunit H